MDNLEEQIDIEEAVETNPQEEEELTPEKVDRYKQQLAGSKAEAERLRQLVIDAEYYKAEQDIDNLIKLNDKDPKLAKEVAKSFGYDSVKEAVDFIYGKNDPISPDIDELVNKRLAEKEHDKAIQKVEKMFSKLDENKKEQANKYFDKITKGQMLDEETALEFAEMTTLYINRDKVKGDKKEEGLAMLGSTGISNSKKGTDKGPQYIVSGGKLILLSNN